MQFDTWLKYDFDELGSTNDKARELAESYQQPLIVSAFRQTQGRGRRGRSWLSTEGNLFVSFAFDGQNFSAGQWALLAGFAVAQTIRYFCPNAEIMVKWPNDVLVQGAKISGILFERADNGFWIMGIGINVVSHPQSENFPYPTISLHTLGAKTHRMEVLEVLIQKFNDLYQTALNDSFDAIRCLWLEQAYNLGQIITIRQDNGDKKGVFDGIDDNGNLLLNVSGHIEKIFYGDLLIEKEHHG